MQPPRTDEAGGRCGEARAEEVGETRETEWEHGEVVAEVCRWMCM